MLRSGAHGYLLPGDREPFESAFLSARGKNVQLDAGADRYEIWDCGEESSGLLEIEVSSAAGCRVELGWGEHLDDLRVRSHIGSRMFQTAVTFGAERTASATIFSASACDIWRCICIR